MTVAEYIKELSKLPQDAKAVVWGCMGPYEPKPYLSTEDELGYHEMSKEKKVVVLG